MTHIHNKFIEWVDLNGAQIRNSFIFIQLLCSVRLCQFSHIYPLMISTTPRASLYFYLCDQSLSGDYYLSSDVIKSCLDLCQNLISQRIQLLPLLWAHTRAVAQYPSQVKVWGHDLFFNLFVFFRLSSLPYPAAPVSCTDVRWVQ